MAAACTEGAIAADVSSSRIEQNTAQGGNGGHSGAHGSGAGGDGLGGGAWLDSDLTLDNTEVSHNKARAGKALGGAHASASGGGVYKDSAITLTQNGSTSIDHNSPHDIGP